MPVGEDIPLLIPVSIVLTVMVLFLISLFINFSEEHEIIKMSQVSLDIADYSANILFAENYGKLNRTKIDGIWNQSDWKGDGCKKLSSLNITSNFANKLEVTDLTTDESWCWKNTFSDDIEVSVSNILPFLIINGNNTDFGQVKVSVSK